MEHLLYIIVLAVLGLGFGSFAGATVWRLRALQLKVDKQHNEPYDKNEFNKLKTLMHTSVSKDRSRCLHCHHTLQWYDLVPLISWISLRGKCRYCHRNIGVFEPLIEVGTMIYFVVSFVFWPHALQAPIDFIQFSLWLAASVGLIIMCVYDLKWMLLPDRVMIPVGVLAVISAAIHVVTATESLAAFYSVLGACLILGGLYLALYALSKGRWVGFGDVKLGFVLGLLIVDWQLALLSLFLANLIGCAITIPLIASKKMTKDTHVPFGPMLVAGWFVATLFGGTMISAYTSLILTI